MKKFELLLKLTCVCALFALVSCASGLKAYQKGDYLKACVEAIDRLRSSPSHKKAQDALAQAYPRAQDNTVREISIALSSKNLNSYDRAIMLYEQLNKLADDISRCPGALAVIPNPTEYHVELMRTKEIVAERSYEEGLVALNRNTMEQARIAYANFSRTNQYVPGYRDVLAKMEEARNMATLRVVVLKPITNSRYQLDADFFYNKLMMEITRNTYHNLVKFYTPEELMAQGGARVHQQLVLDFADYTVGNSREISNTVELKRDSVLIGTSKGQNVYGTVKAKYTINRIELSSSGVMIVKVIESNSNKVLSQRSFAGNSLWKTEWASYNGDERALSKEQLALVGRKPRPLPPPQELFASFANPLYAQATRYISTIYK